MADDTQIQFGGLPALGYLIYNALRKKSEEERMVQQRREELKYGRTVPVPTTEPETEDQYRYITPQEIAGERAQETAASLPAGSSVQFQGPENSVYNVAGPPQAKPAEPMQPEYDPTKALAQIAWNQYLLGGLTLPEFKSQLESLRIKPLNEKDQLAMERTRQLMAQTELQMSKLQEEISDVDWRQWFGEMRRAFYISDFMSMENADSLGYDIARQVFEALVREGIDEQTAYNSAISSGRAKVISPDKTTVKVDIEGKSVAVPVSLSE